MEEPLSISLISDEGEEQLKLLEKRVYQAGVELEGLIDRLSRAVAELDPEAQFTQEPNLQGKIVLLYGADPEFFYAGDRELLKSANKVSYHLQINYETKHLELRFEPESVIPQSHLSVKDVGALNEKWGLLRRVNKNVHQVLLEYAQEHQLQYTSHFRYRLQAPEGQEYLKGFTGEDAGEDGVPDDLPL